jgi:hypothetical protein
MSWDYESRVVMGFFGGRSEPADTGRTSAQGGNGNVKNSRSEHNHEALATPNLAAVRDLHHGSSNYVGRHRAE